MIAAVGGLLFLKAVALVTGVSGLGPAVAQDAPAAEAAPAPSTTPAARSRDAVLESLAQRRETLEAQEAELRLRENLLKATETRVEERIAELREIETRINTAIDQRRQEDEERIAGLVTMYESMKPKDAARIFDQLEMDVLLRVVQRMKARAMSEILAAMQPQVAKRLTVELAAEPRNTLDSGAPGGELPQIIGTQPAG